MFSIYKKTYCKRCGKEVPLIGGQKIADGYICTPCKKKLQPYVDIRGIQFPELTENTISEIEAEIRVQEEAEKQSQMKKTKQGVIILAGLSLALLAISALSSGTSKDKKESVAEEQTTETSDKAEAEETNFTITKDTEYAFMSDEWNVYIARAVSDSIIKIEHWDKTSQSTKKLKYRDDIGTFKINDSENGFRWIDDEHTAFEFVFSDKNNSRVKKAASHIFTININNNDVFKGSDFDESIACYTYVNDDWHMYRAIPLSDNLIKIECWARVSSMDDYCFGWDWWVLNPDNNTGDFEWTDDEHTSFTMTTKDESNSHWKKESFVLFELENKGYKYPTVYAFLNPVEETTIDNTPSDQESNTPINSVPEQTADNQENDRQEQSKTNEMPVMPGTSIDTATSRASEYGVTVLYDDDFGYGTHCSAYQDSSGGLMMDIIYSTSSGEILSATIATNNLVSFSTQQDFIKHMAPVLCPSSDATDVTSWVNSNVGSHAKTEFNGFVYELSLGPVDNALYESGYENWEQWELSHN